jgi:hypothetical protein
MKTRPAVYLLLVAIAATMLFGCSGSKKEETANQQEPSTAPTYAVDVAFQQQLSDVFTSYVPLKDAFVASDTALVKSKAADVKKALSDVKGDLLSGEARDKWAEYLNGMDGALMEIQGTADIEAQRGAFSIFSNNLYNSLKSYGTAGIKAYYEFCPMAFNNKGAYWLSESDVIRNPYFGSKMLSCGSVEETIE